MPAGLQVEGICFNETALVDRPEHAAVLGRIFTSWSLIEASIAGLLGLMMHADHRAAQAVLATFKTSSGRVNAVRKVGKAMLDTTMAAKLDTLMKDVLAYADEHNAIAHTLWGMDKDEPDLVYRMPMTAITNLAVEMPHYVDFDVESLVNSLKKQMAAYTVTDLERIEQSGRDILTRVMREMTRKGYSRAVEIDSE